MHYQHIVNYILLCVGYCDMLNCLYSGSSAFFIPHEFESPEWERMALFRNDNDLCLSSGYDYVLFSGE